MGGELDFINRQDAKDAKGEELGSLLGLAVTTC
jgi:hypothetical protein